MIGLCNLNTSSNKSSLVSTFLFALYDYSIVHKDTSSQVAKYGVHIYIYICFILLGRISSFSL